MIEIEDTGDIRILRLNRPDKANAVTEKMLSNLADAVQMSTSKVIILTGNGKVFSAGADLAAAKAGLATSPVWEHLSGAIADFPGLTVCALNGTVAGGSMGMFLACDLRISVPGARIFYPVMKLGFLPQPSDPPRLRALVGPSRAKQILMSGQKITVEEAANWGLIDRIVAPDDLTDTAHELSADVLSATPEHAAAIKRLIG